MLSFEDSPASAAGAPRRPRCGWRSLDDSRENRALSTPCGVRASRPRAPGVSPGARRATPALRLRDDRAMRCVIQRVRRASVSVGGEVVAAIDAGMLVLAGVEKGDGEEAMREAARKIRELRVF